MARSPKPTVIKAEEGTTFTVTNTNDSGEGSLRAAIEAANATAGIDRIVFNIEGEGPHVINVQSGLPRITEAVVIDGYTQPGARPNTQAVGSNAVIKIVLDGTGAANRPVALRINASDTTIRGLSIVNFENFAMHLEPVVSNTLIAGNYIGTYPDGQTAGANNSGISLGGNSNNRIGTLDPADRNIIANSVSEGILGTVVSGIEIAGNYIGTDASGTQAAGNYEGVRFSDRSDSNNVFGNVISGNKFDGVVVMRNTTNTTLQGNFIGVDVTGANVLGNVRHGVFIDELASQTFVGGDEGLQRNVISGNGLHGVRIHAESSNNTIQGNYIGINAAGLEEIGNVSGVVIEGDENLIRNNVISGNLSHGIVIDSGDHNEVELNIIGLNAPATFLVQNINTGVRVSNGGRFNRIGFGALGEGNLIAGGRIGVEISGQTTRNNSVSQNVFGVTPSGRVFTFTENAIRISNGADNNFIGSLDRGNVIGGAREAAILVQGPGTEFNDIRYNAIGTDLTGTADAGNNSDGVLLEQSSTTTLQDNIIAFNRGNGVRIVDSEQNHVARNRYYGNHLLAIDLGGDGPTDNDPLDADPGPNALQNKPVLTGALAGNDGLVVTGRLNSLPDKVFSITFYANSQPDPSGFGEGEVVLGSIDARTDANGDATFQFSTSNFDASMPFITATATENLYRNTSEFSAAVEVRQTADLRIEKTADSPVVVAGGRLTYTITVTNDGPAEAVNITVIDLLPEGVRFIEATAPEGFTEPSVGERLITFTSQSMANGQSATFTIVVEVWEDFVDGQKLLNEAAVLAGTPDANQTNNDTTVETEVIGFDMSLQDNSNGCLLLFNSRTGDYLFTNCETGFRLAGKGDLTVRGCEYTLIHVTSDRRMQARLNDCQRKGTASVQVFSPAATFTITDSETKDNNFGCLR